MALPPQFQPSDSSQAFPPKKAVKPKKKAKKKKGHKQLAKVAVKKKLAAKPNPNAPLGQGGRFAALQQKLSGKSGVTDPGALAASIGKKKYGVKKFGQLGARGR